MSEKYRIIQKLDAGGMAEVYKGIQDSGQGIERLVAIKRVLPHLAKNQKFVEMFLDEARLSMNLNHANVVHLIDLGRSADTYFIVMEFIDGTNLKAIVEYFRNQGRTVPVEQAIFLCSQICSGLGYAHDLRNPVTGKALGIVHRDISPPNVLVSRQGEVKLVDFGLAKASNQISKTDQGVVKGKFSYLSPEAALGETVDRRTDIFAVGIILWEFLAGKRLFYGETDFQTVELVRKAQIPSLSTLNPQVSPELDDIIRMSLARDPENRYQTAHDFGDALTQYLFSHKLKVTPYDIGRLIEDILSAKAAKSSNDGGNLIHDLIQEELFKFNSIADDEEEENKKANAPKSSESLIDPRSDWGDLFNAESSGSLPATKSQLGQNLANQIQGGGDGLAALLEPEKAMATSGHPVVQTNGASNNTPATNNAATNNATNKQDLSTSSAKPSSNAAIYIILVLLLVLGGVGAFALKLI
jgi:serine/threonine protein kinase